MATKRLYLESEVLTIQATVTGLGDDDRGHYVILDKTIAHAQGGGARSDRGSIDMMTFAEVVSTDGRDGDVYHYLHGEPSFSVGDTVEIKIDPEWRKAQAKSHSGGHLIASLAEVLYPSLKAVAGHHFIGECRVELAGDPFPADLNDLKTKLDAALKNAIERDLPIRVVGNPYQNRQIQIGDYHAIPCGGVHCKGTRELGRVEIKSVKVKNGKLRLSYEVRPCDTSWFSAPVDSKDFWWP